MRHLPVSGHLLLVLFVDCLVYCYATNRKTNGDVSGEMIDGHCHAQNDLFLGLINKKIKNLNLKVRLCKVKFTYKHRSDVIADRVRWYSNPFGVYHENPLKFYQNINFLVYLCKNLSYNLLFIPIITFISMMMHPSTISHSI